MVQMNDRNTNWRMWEILKTIRQCTTCPLCGSFVCTQEGYNKHAAWHSQTNNYIDVVDKKFDQIHVYVRGEGGLEDRMKAAIATTNTSVTTLRTETTTAITADRSRLSTIEDEIARPTTGLRARLTLLEALGLK